ncbi:Exocyst complex component sec6 [Astathelohania contejeani]|uniref:Exocyst complex component sec6 n=1 Tax=Astathelohania contejeani TaxID=164912 RepID=A0ABQ7HYY3_9MICR|nr:Exocyst complex component sec6 [Thelohania contejeani]
MDDALSKLSDHLKHPSDLDDKLPHIEHQTQKDMKKLYRTLAGSLISAHPTTIPFDIITDKLTKYSNNFPKISQINTSNPTDENTNKLCIAYTNLINLRLFVERLEEYSKIGPNKDLLVWHYNVYQAEEFQSEVLSLVDELDARQIQSIRRRIKPISQASYEFTLNILKLGENLLKQSKDTIHDILRIIEKEDKRDIEIKKIKEIENQKKAIFNRKYLKSSPKELSNKFYDTVKTGIKRKFEENSFEFVQKDLETIKCWETPDLALFLINQYSSCLRGLIESSNLDAGEILALLEFVGEYDNTLKILFAMPSPQLLIGREEKLISTYIEAATGKLDGWMENLIETEVSSFKTRTEAPSLDEHGKYISTGFITLLSLVKQQLEPVSFHTALSNLIAGKLVGHGEKFAKAIITAIETDNKKIPGYEEYVVMMGNSGLRITRYVQQIGAPVELATVFLGITKAANEALSSYIIHTCKPVLDIIFTDPWYDGNILALTETLKDFFSDYKMVMEVYAFKTLLNVVAGNLCQAYLKQLKRKRAVLYRDCGSRLDRDIEEIREVFEQYESGAKLDVIAHLSPLITCGSIDIFLIELKAMRLNVDVDKDVVKSIIKKREDLSNEEKEIFSGRLVEIYGEKKKKKKRGFFF